MIKLIIAGGRDFTDRQRMYGELFHLYQEGKLPEDFELVCGMARGADLTAYDLLKNATKVHKFYADWNGPYGKGAGFARNRDMARFADILVAFWDGESRGTKHMIETMQGLQKPVHIISY